MAAIRLHGRPIESVFELVGSHENAMTFALGWCMAHVSKLIGSIAAEIEADAPGSEATVSLQRHESGRGITDLEVHDPGSAVWIFEAKAGFEPPAVDQLTMYAHRLLELEDRSATKLLVVLARSDPQGLWLKMLVPSAIEGIPVRVISWNQIKACVKRCHPTADNTGKALLRQFSTFLDKVIGMQVVNSNEVYVVSLSNATFGGGPTTFIEVVEKFSRYFHPVGSGWPVSPPNYMGFRWDGRLQSIHHVDSYEIIRNFAPYFPEITDGEIDPHFLYHLGPAIRPSREVRTGTNVRWAKRIYAHLDLLLTSETISEAGVKTRERIEMNSVR